MAAKNVPAPGYSTTKKLMPPIVEMLSELGAQDACIQLQELSIEYLCDAAANTDASIGEFLNPLYKAKNIPQGSYEFDQLRALASRSYLVATYSLVEKMLRGIIAEYKQASPDLATGWKSKDSSGENLSPLRELTDNLPAALGKPLQSCPEFRLLEYYRLVRVANSHVKNSTLAKAIKAHKATVPDIEHLRTYAPSNAPNPPDMICFDDFVLFTRATKYYSKLLNEACG